jgi:hypothetical protein
MMHCMALAANRQSLVAKLLCCLAGSGKGSQLSELKAEEKFNVSLGSICWEINV